MTLAVRRSILVVDDDDAVRRVLVRRLRTWGYEVIESASGDDAIEAARQHGAVDLLLSDLVMPGMTGIEAASRISETRPAMPIVFMSGHQRDDVVDAACALPGRYFIEKPFEAAALSKLLDSIFQDAAIAPPADEPPPPTQTTAEP